MADIERVFCDICGKDSNRPLGDFIFQDTPLTLVKCFNCGLVYVNPRLSFEQRNIYFQKYMDGSDKNAQRWKEYRDPNFKSDVRLLRRFPNAKRLLDVGCGYGFFLKEARTLGCDTYGIEVSVPPSLYAKDKLGLDVRNCTLEKANFPEAYFDVVTILDVIGYLQSPSCTLVEINRILKKGGVIIIRTLDRLTYLKAYMVLMRLLKKQTHLDQNPFFENDRNYHYSSKTLKNLLLAKGFCEIRFFNARMGYWGTESWIIRWLRYCFMFFVDFIWFISMRKICLAPSITVVAKKEKDLLGAKRHLS